MEDLRITKGDTFADRSSSCGIGQELWVFRRLFFLLDERVKEDKGLVEVCELDRGDVILLPALKGPDPNQEVCGRFTPSLTVLH